MNHITYNGQTIKYNVFDANNNHAAYDAQQISTIVHHVTGMPINGGGRTGYGFPDGTVILAQTRPLANAIYREIKK